MDSFSWSVYKYYCGASDYHDIHIYLHWRISGGYTYNKWSNKKRLYVDSYSRQIIYGILLAVFLSVEKERCDLLYVANSNIIIKRRSVSGLWHIFDYVWNVSFIHEQFSFHLDAMPIVSNNCPCSDNTKQNKIVKTTQLHVQRCRTSKNQKQKRNRHIILPIWNEQREKLIDVSRTKKQQLGLGCVKTESSSILFLFWLLQDINLVWQCKKHLIMFLMFLPR